MRRYGWLVVALVLLAVLAWQQWPRRPASMPQPPAAVLQAPQPPPLASRSAHTGSAWPGFLPPEAVATLRRVEAGGPFAHRQDGGIFQNRERRLPPQPRGYYREYTVETPGSRDRGARRLISGGRPPVEYFYSDDHYRSFRRFTPSGARP
jgi:guanyl-specific ribonuclease Sa